MACFEWVEIHNVIIVILCLTTYFEACSGEGLNVEIVSPKTVFVKLGQPLRLQINLHQLDIDKWNTTGCWMFYNSDPNNLKDLVILRKIGQHDGYNFSYSPRASVVRQVDLLLMNTTLKDTGKYMFIFRRPPSKRWNTSVLFSVTVEETPSVELTCSNTVQLREGDQFSCCCKAIPRPGRFIPNVSWIKEGQMIRKSSQLSQSISFDSFNKGMVGTYICRANIGTLVDEKTVEISVIQSEKKAEQNATEHQTNSVKGWKKINVIIISASIGVSGIFFGIFITIGIRWIQGKKRKRVPADHDYERPQDYLHGTILDYERPQDYLHGTMYGYERPQEYLHGSMLNYEVVNNPGYQELNFREVEENGNTTYQSLLLNAMKEKGKENEMLCNKVIKVSSL